MVTRLELETNHREVWSFAIIEKAFSLLIESALAFSHLHEESIMKLLDT